MKLHTQLITAAFFLTGSALAKEEQRPLDDSQDWVRHVLLISVDGLHHQDLDDWTNSHPSSALSYLSRHGVVYRDAHAPTPSDSFPGLLALVTGGTPKTTGVYYDDSYDRTLYAPGSGCAGAPGSEIVYDESIDHDLNRLFSGGIAAGPSIPTTSSRSTRSSKWSTKRGCRRRGPTSIRRTT